MESNLIQDSEDNNKKLNINKKNEKSETERKEMIKKEETISSMNEEIHIKKKNKDLIDDKKEKKEEKNEDKKEVKNEEEEKKSYKIDSSYQNKLISELKKQNILRPKTLFAPDYEDITKNIGKLNKEEQINEKLEEIDDLNADIKDKEDKTFLNKCKESSLNGQTLLQDPYALFSGAEQVYIDQYYKITDLFVICPLYYNYRISLEYCVSNEGDKRKYEAYYLFYTKEISPACSHNFLPNQSRDIDINIFNFIINPSDDKKVQKFITIRKPCRCAFSCFCACCTRPVFLVETLIEQLGKIIEIQTICDPVIHILDPYEDIKYVISTKCFQCGYFLRDAFCDNRTCATCEFIIYDKLKNALGKISKDHKSGKRLRPDYDQLVVTFPPSCSCKDKILIVCAALTIEYLYFQNMTNIKRCNGTPKFLYTSL